MSLLLSALSGAASLQCFFFSVVRKFPLGPCSFPVGLQTVFGEIISADKDSLNFDQAGFRPFGDVEHQGSTGNTC